MFVIFPESLNPELSIYIYMYVYLLIEERQMIVEEMAIRSPALWWLTTVLF